MAKHLYDPHMFNYMWESCIPSGDFIVGTYYIEDTLKAKTSSITWARSSGWRRKAPCRAGWTSRS